MSFKLDCVNFFYVDRLVLPLFLDGGNRAELAKLILNRSTNGDLNNDLVLDEASGKIRINYLKKHKYFIRFIIGETPLHVASELGLIDVVNLLVTEKGNLCCFMPRKDIS